MKPWRYWAKGLEKGAKLGYNEYAHMKRKKGAIPMKYTFTGRNFNISEELKAKTQQKIGKIEKLLPPEAEAAVTFSTIKQRPRIEVTIPLKKRILRAEVSSDSTQSALDDVADVLEKQMIKYKNRLRDKYKRDSSFKDELSNVESVADAEEPEIFIDRNKHFSLKPMDAEEAVMEMEMLGHSFYVFRNGSTDVVNVVYKRNNGSYGLIEPEY
jgi:putative sigma-54 modulation protein